MPLTFVHEKCTGCKLCQLACSGSHENAFNPVKARLTIIHDYTDDGLLIKSHLCIFCKKCEAVCPVNAISNNGRWMIVDRDTCSGCGTCVKNCPTDVIYLDKDGTSVICDLCHGEPQCVTWCPKGVLALKERVQQ